MVGTGIRNWGRACLAIGLLTLGACAEALLDIDAHGSEIVNGEITEGDPAVVALTYRGNYFCSGSLITDRVILTAAHCMPEHLIPYPDPNEFTESGYQEALRERQEVVTGLYPQIEIFFGNDTLSQDGEYYKVLTGRPHPDYILEASLPEYSNDIGLLVLEQSVSVEPLSVQRLPLELSDLGKSARAVGFGNSSGEQGGSGGGIKRTGTLLLSHYLNDLQVVATADPSRICNGDSGGPLLMGEGDDEKILGINSWGLGTTCRSDSGFERVDVHVDSFITPFVIEHTNEQCVQDNRCGFACGILDPDCSSGDPDFVIVEPAQGSTVDPYVDIVVESSIANSIETVEVYLAGERVAVYRDVPFSFVTDEPVPVGDQTLLVRAIANGRQYDTEIDVTVVEGSKAFAAATGEGCNTGASSHGGLVAMLSSYVLIGLLMRRNRKPRR